MRGWSIASVSAGTALICAHSLWAQAFVDVNLALPTGACELDHNRDGLVDGTFNFSSWGADWQVRLGANTFLDSSRKFGGGFSQAVHFNRASGEAGSVTLAFPLIHSNLSIPLQPRQPLLVRARYFAEGFQNAEYEILIRSGDAHTQLLLPATSRDSGGWQTISTVAIVQAAADGQLVLNLRLRLQVGAGAARGRIWIDEVECLLPEYPAPPGGIPTPIRLSIFNLHPPHWTGYLSAPLPAAAVQQMHVGLPLKRLFGNRVQHYLYVHAMNYPLDPPPANCRLLYGCEHFLITQPDWVLRDQHGNPIIYQLYNTYFLDIGLPQLRQRAIDGFSALAAEFPTIDGFFIDGFADWPGSCPRYPTYESILFPAWDNWVRDVFPVIRQSLRKKVFVNIGARPGLVLHGRRPVEQWLPHIDAILIEGAIASVNYSARTYTARPYYVGPNTNYYAGSWRNTVQCIRDYPNTEWHLILYWDHRDQQRSLLRYSLATYWLVYRPNVYLSLEDRLDPSYSHLTSLAQPEVWVPLGEPLAPYEIIQGNWNDGGLFQRRFQHGIVLVNPTDNTTYRYTTSQAYKNWDGQVVAANTPITIPPKTGVVLYAAPEVRVSIEAQPTTALPEELVTIRVECRNVGLAEARNLEVKVPIPQGLNVVSVSDGGVASNGEVKWSLPSLAPNASRQFQIRARVQ
jgi:hypothetical protein